MFGQIAAVVMLAALFTVFVMLARQYRTHRQELHAAMMRNVELAGTELVTQLQEKRGRRRDWVYMELCDETGKESGEHVMVPYAHICMVRWHWEDAKMVYAVVTVSGAFHLRVTLAAAGRAWDAHSLNPDRTHPSVMTPKGRG